MFRNDEFVTFIAQLEELLLSLDIVLTDHIIDHVCFRVRDIDEFHCLSNELGDLSVLHTNKVFHGRSFLMFVLREPYQFKGQRIPYLEFSEPGGSDSYETGFQHIELLSTKPIQELGNNEKIQILLYTNKSGDETYLKWDDKLVVKATHVPLITKSFLDDNPQIVYQ